MRVCESNAVVVLQRGAEATAIGVVAAELAVFHPQGIDGFGGGCIRRGAVAAAPGGLFEGNGDVQPAPAVGKEAGDGGGKFCFITGKDTVVAQVDAARGGESGVDLR